jgi:L-seryl-tRNA(Ser) seleniumtransferase
MAQDSSSAAEQLRRLPGVGELLDGAQDLVALEGRARVVEALRRALEEARSAIRAGGDAPQAAALIAEAGRRLRADSAASSSGAVINATGVIIHTNLGRALLSTAAQQAMQAVAAHYSPLEYDLEAGQRGARGQAVEQLACDVTGAQAALVVNNCAAATVLMLSAIARGRAVVISRGQLVEIGGGFRIPDILRQSGAELVEVGTTNRTRLSDYEQAIMSRQSAVGSRQSTADCRLVEVGAILRVHSSNFRMIGFTEEVPIAELVALSRAAAQSPISNPQSPIPVLDDIGSGALVDMAQFGLSREPMPQESVQAGAAVVAFSGDKLLGGPQAGILAGRREPIEACRRHPLARAFRADKYTLAALGATMLHYARGEAAREVPVLRMIALPPDAIARRAQALALALVEWAASRGAQVEVIGGRSTVGGGSLPGETLPTWLVALTCQRPDALAAELRAAPVPIIARIQDDRVLLDPRTVLDDEALIRSVVSTPTI